MPFYNSRDRVDDWDHFDHHSIGTTLRFAWLPKRCWLSDKRLWLQFAYRKVAMWTGPGEPVFEYRWYDKDEYLIAKLKGMM